MPQSSDVRLTEKSRRSRPDETERLVAAELGDDGAGVGAVPLEQAVLEAAETEEVVLLLDLVDHQLVDRTEVAGEQFLVGVVLLAAHAVLAAIPVELDVAGVVAALQQLDHGVAMAGLGRADEVGVGDVQPGPRVDVLRRDAIHELTRRLADRLGRLLHLEPVLVGARDEPDVLAEQPVPPRERIADDRRVGVAEVRLGRHVVDGGRRIEPAHPPDANEQPPPPTVGYSSVRTPIGTFDRRGLRVR